MSKKIELVAFQKGYRINNLGEVFSKTGKKLKVDVDKQGYYRVSIRTDKGCRAFMIHRLVAFQKYGNKIYNKGIEVRHLNNNKIDNSYDNIAIGNHKDNILDIPSEIRLKRALNASSYLKKYDYKKIKEFHKKNGKPYTYTMSEFGITSKGTLYYILNN